VLLFTYPLQNDVGIDLRVGERARARAHFISHHHTSQYSEVYDSFFPTSSGDPNQYIHVDKVVIHSNKRNDALY